MPPSLPTLLLASLPCALSAISITGLTSPVSFTYDPATGFGFIAELSGLIKRTCLSCSTATLAKNLTSTVFASGWHGLTSVSLQANYLYATYTRAPPGSASCVDTGSGAGSQPRSSVLGCPKSGALVRWAYNPIDGTLGADPPTDLLPLGFACSQFSNGGIAQVLAHPTNAGQVYVSTGVGALDTPNGGPDYGQYGGGPCTFNTSMWGGHFNALDSSSTAGKIFLVTLPTPTSPLTYSTLALGFKNPWRMATGAGGALYAVDMGSQGESQDELNGPITSGASYGWPCYLGSGGPVAQYQDILFSPCKSTALPAQTPPFFSTPRRAPGVAGSMSALEYLPSQQRYYFADASAGTVSSYRPADASVWVHSTAMYAVQLLYLPPAVCAGLAQGVCSAPASGAMLAVQTGYGGMANGKITEVLTSGFAPTSSASGAGAGAAALALCALALCRLLL